MAKLVEDATLHVFEDAGHMTFVEANEEYLEAVAAFLEGGQSMTARI